MIIGIQKTDPRALIPTLATDGAAAYDLYALILEGDDECINTSQSGVAYSIPPGDKRKIGTGIRMAIPRGHVGLIFPRSGKAHDCGLRLSNCVGVIDSDFRGEVKVSLYNDSSITQVVKTGERVGQILFLRLDEVTLLEWEKLDDTERGDGGFGSTGR